MTLHGEQCLNNDAALLFSVNLTVAKHAGIFYRLEL